MVVPEVVTLEAAKRQLRITHTNEDDDLQEKLEAATEAVLDHLVRRDETWNATMEAWTVDTVPRSIRQAILVYFGTLMHRRGDDDPGTAGTSRPGALPPEVEALIARYRAPAVA